MAVSSVALSIATFIPVWRVFVRVLNADDIAFDEHVDPPNPDDLGRRREARGLNINYSKNKADIPFARPVWE
jgi:hypothetical protein